MKRVLILSLALLAGMAGNNAWADSDACSSAYTACQARCDATQSGAQRVGCKSECVAEKSACKTGSWGRRTGDAISGFFGGGGGGGSSSSDNGAHALDDTP